MSRALHCILTDRADRIALQTKFVQRASKLTGSVFVQPLVLGFLEQPEASLSCLCQVASDMGVEITKQGMQKRLTPSAVALLARIFEESKSVLHNRIPIPLELLTRFTAVQLVDSSSIALPDSLAQAYPGAGGTGPQAALKLQTMWEFTRGNLTAVILQSGRQPDHVFRAHLDHIVAGALFLCDLGYFNLGSLGAMAAGDAYFISRLDTHCVLYDPQSGQRCDLLSHLHRSSQPQEELDLLVGRTARLPCRVLAVRLPAAVVAERQRRARANAQRKGRTLSANRLAWLAWNVYITNVPATMLTFRQVILIYTLRWQIELLFKLWKSEAHLNRVAGRLRERVLSEIYAKLIGMVIFHFLTAPVRWAERELSATKALHTFRRHIIEIAKALHAPAQLRQVLDRLLTLWQRFALKDRRRSRLSTCTRIDLAGGQPLQAPLFAAQLVEPNPMRCQVALG